MPDQLPQHPRFADRRGLALIITRECFPISPRTLETWPLTWRHVNGKAVAEVAEALAVAEARLAAAPLIRGGRRPASAAA